MVETEQMSIKMVILMAGFHLMSSDSAVIAEYLMDLIIKCLRIRNYGYIGQSNIEYLI
jgi:hypothetical protein